MVADVNFQRVTALPFNLAPNTLYFVKPNGAALASLFSTGNDSVPVPIGGVTTALVAGNNVTLTQQADGTTRLDATGGGGTGGGDMFKAQNLAGLTNYALARSNLGLGSLATQSSSSVTITGGSVTGITDLAVADGGTGASTPAGAIANLGLGTLATQNASSVNITGGTIAGITDIAIADGGTGSSTAVGARAALGAAASGANTDITSITGSAAKLTTARTIALTGDVSYTSPAFDGSGNVTATATLANSGVAPGSYTNANITVDAKGRVTAAANGSGGASGAAITDIDYGVNFTASGDAYIPARVAMTLAQGNAPIGTGSLAYAASTAAAPGTFTTATLPVTLQAGAWLKITASGVSGFLSADLYRTA